MSQQGHSRFGWLHFEIILQSQQSPRLIFRPCEGHIRGFSKVNRAPGWYFRAHEGQIQVITLRNQPEKSIAPDYPREMMVELNWKGKDILGWLGLSIGHWGAVALPVITFCSVSHSYSQYNYIAVQFCICSSLPPYNIWVQNILVEIYCTDSTIAACREINGLCHIHQGATARELRLGS